MTDSKTIDQCVQSKTRPGYTEKYVAQQFSYLYPTEYLVRLFLGNHELAGSLKADSHKKALLDYSAGDGRNSSFFLEQGYQVYATEISVPICAVLNKKFAEKSNWRGSSEAVNCRFGKGSEKFDIIVACHSIYYMGEDDKFSDYLKRLKDKLKPGGYLIASFVTPDNYYFSTHAERKEDYLRVDSDPLRLRNGQIMFVPRTKDRLVEVIEDQLDLILINRVHAEYPNVTEEIYWVVARLGR
jgi:SAM-dependent methyltransferase